MALQETGNFNLLSSFFCTPQHYIWNYKLNIIQIFVLWTRGRGWSLITFLDFKLVTNVICLYSKHGFSLAFLIGFSLPRTWGACRFASLRFAKITFCSWSDMSFPQNLSHTEALCGICCHKRNIVGLLTSSFNLGYKNTSKIFHKTEL